MTTSRASHRHGRKVGFVSLHGLSENERYARYDACFDMVNQLAADCRRKLDTVLGWPIHDLLRKVRIAIQGRGEWEFSVGKVNWMIKIVGQHGMVKHPHATLGTNHVALHLYGEAEDTVVFVLALPVEAGSLGFFFSCDISHPPGTKFPVIPSGSSERPSRSSEADSIVTVRLGDRLVGHRMLDFGVGTKPVTKISS